MRPRNILINTMIVMSNGMDPGELIGYLNRFLAAAVITKEEDALLTSAGVGKLPADQNDPNPWARYVTAGIDVTDFRPLVGA